MIKKIKQFILVGLTGLIMVPGLLAVVSAGVATAAISDSLCTGAGAASGEPCPGTEGGNVEGTLTNLATTITNWFSIIVGAISIIMIIYGGFRYITSGGDSGRVGTAKNTIIYALVGLIIVVLAQVIVNVVVGQSKTLASPTE